jgi:histidinol dehydrogenase
VRIIEIDRAITAELVSEMIPRAAISIESVLPAVEQIIAEARKGESAILDQCERFDGVRPASLRVPKAALERALTDLEPTLRQAIELAIARVRAVSEANLPQATVTELAGSATVSQRWQPISAVGLYVPGGKAVYPSSVVMNVVPAQVAKVGRIAIASPPQSSGLPHPTVLAAAALLGIDEVYSVGGASAVAAFAFGVPGVLEPVKLVTGPGNIFVAAAKRALRGVIGIDSEAGPTEVMIIADESANPKLLAADLISQAEHDENAAAVLVTTSIDIAYQVNAELERQLAQTKNRERATVALAGKQSATLVVSDLASAVAIANHYATEHLELHTADPVQLAMQITDAGAIFIGENSPVSLGDYLAGSNHVLPTGGAAHFSSGLGVHTFLRPQQLIEYSKPALYEVADSIQVFAAAEGLDAHGDAVRLRFEEN